MDWTFSHTLRLKCRRPLFLAPRFCVRRFFLEPAGGEEATSACEMVVVAGATGPGGVEGSLRFIAISAPSARGGAWNGPAVGGSVGRGINAGGTTRWWCGR